jgi:hypothetical protein
MNIPPPRGAALSFKVEAGEPVTVRVKYQGQSYIIRMTTTVMSVHATGITGPDGIPVFNIQGAPVMIAAKEDAS